MPVSKQIIGVGVAIGVIVTILIVVVNGGNKKKCNLVCKNSGILSKECTCGCKSPWSGQQCETCELKCNPGYTPDTTCVNCLFKCPDFSSVIGQDVTQIEKALTTQYPALNFVPTEEGAMTIRNVVQNRVRLYYDKVTNLITKIPRCG